MKLSASTKQIHPVFQTGFSLVELIVSLALFSVVITISVGALLLLIASNDQLQKEQSVMTNLSFALDSMTREIRTGIHYYCTERSQANAGGPNSVFRVGNDIDDVLGDTQNNDCATGRTYSANINGVGKFHGLAFIEAGDSLSGTGKRILYYHERGTGKIFRKIGAESPQSIVSSGIYIEDLEFFVTGSETLREDSNADDQASVTIFIIARDANDPTRKQFSLQTTVTQRTLDI